MKGHDYGIQCNYLHLCFVATFYFVHDWYNERKMNTILSGLEFQEVSQYMAHCWILELHTVISQNANLCPILGYGLSHSDITMWLIILWLIISSWDLQMLHLGTTNQPLSCFPSHQGDYKRLSNDSHQKSLPKFPCFKLS